MPTTKESSPGKRVAHRRKELSIEVCGQVYPRVTFSALPDDILLEIFDFYLVTPYRRHDEWHTLVHVCQRWRFVVFASPHRLQLRLLCTDKTPVQNMLNIWPDLPIVIKGRRGMSKLQDANHIVAALKQHNRVCEINVINIDDTIPNALLNRIRAMEMKSPFSALTSLWLHSLNINAPALPDSFLGGSAPRLQKLALIGVPFPALPKLLWSTPDLVALYYWNVPLFGYISPEAMVAGLSALTRLKSLHLGFRSPQSWAERLVPRETRIVLPALTDFVFKGESEYLEDIVAQIDTPLLDQLFITFFHQLIFDTPLLRDFISRTETFKAPHRADVHLSDEEVYVWLYWQYGTDKHRILLLVISCGQLYLQLSSLAQLCNSVLSHLTTLERLEVKDYRQYWEDGADNGQWAELFHPFTSVKDLVLHGKLVQLATPALEELAEESVTEVLPALQDIFLGGPPPSEPDKKAIRQFITARQLSGRPVAVHHPYWEP